jgi:hypothetical protein
MARIESLGVQQFGAGTFFDDNLDIAQAVPEPLWQPIQNTANFFSDFLVCQR